MKTGGEGPVVIPAQAAQERAESEDRRRIQSVAPERRQQIVTAAVAVIARYGLTGATNRRIAEGAGISPPALYLYFDSQQEILCAAMDLVGDRVFQWLSLSSKANAIERLRETGSLHASFMAEEFEGFVLPSFEFITSAQELELRQRWGQKQQSFHRAMADIIEQGKTEGSVRGDVDAEVAAWQFTMFAMLEDIARLTGRDDYITSGTSMKVLDQFLAGIATQLEATTPELRAENAPE
ncbi:MAG TPA: TetR/AcrR family transcriptional regulator [Thermoleophilia bacterium]